MLLLVTTKYVYKYTFAPPYVKSRLRPYVYIVFKKNKNLGCPPGCRSSHHNKDNPTDDISSVSHVCHPLLHAIVDVTDKRAAHRSDVCRTFAMVDALLWSSNSFLQLSQTD